MSNDDEERPQALEFCRRSFTAIEKLEELFCTDPHARELHNAILWPPATWLREFLVALYECDYDGVPGSDDAGMYKEITKCVHGWGFVMEHRTLVQRSSHSVQRELCSPIEQPGNVAKGN